MAEDLFDRTGLSGTWQLQSPVAQPPARAEITLQLRAGSVAGMSGVNRYRGQVEVQPDADVSPGVAGRLQFGPLATTLMAGPPAAMAAEQAFLTALSQVDGFRLAGDALVLLTGGEPALHFRRAGQVMTC